MREVRAAGPAGTVVAWAAGTFHRGTALTLPHGARYTIHLAYRPAGVEWGQRMPWVGRSHDLEWYRFGHRATPRQLALFGFPPPGHPYWTDATLAGTAHRYAGLNMTPWQQALRGERGRRRNQPNLDPALPVRADLCRWWRSSSDAEARAVAN